MSLVCRALTRIEFGLGISMPTRRRALLAQPMVRTVQLSRPERLCSFNRPRGRPPATGLTIRCSRPSRDEIPATFRPSGDRVRCEITGARKKAAAGGLRASPIAEAAGRVPSARIVARHPGRPQRAASTSGMSPAASRASRLRGPARARGESGLRIHGTSAGESGRFKRALAGCRYSCPSQASLTQNETRTFRSASGSSKAQLGQRMD